MSKKKTKPEAKEPSNSKRGMAQRYAKEFTAAKKHAETWKQNAKEAVNRYLDKREQSSIKTRWNFFPANVQMKAAVLYGSPPKVSVTRRFQDAKDELARVSAELLERLLNTDLQRDTDDYASSLRDALFDRLVAGIGLCRLRYCSEEEPVPGKPAITTKEKQTDEETGEEVESEKELAPAVPDTSKTTFEDVETVYVHWEDVLWNKSRTLGEVRVVFFRERMGRKALKERFGDVGELVPLNSGQDKRNDDSQKDDPWGRADVWEIWDKENERVVWWVEGFPEALDVKDDPYELDGFWPFPTPMLANLSTSDFAPLPDYTLCKDIYQEIDDITERCALLEQAIAVRGCYDKTSKELQSIIGGAKRNEWVPVSNWGAFAEKGGINGSMAFVPLEPFTAALNVLREYRQELINTVSQMDGTSDIARGQQMENGTPGEAQVKARFAGIRIQQLQEQFASFASDVQRIRAQLIAKFWSVETILERSNAQYTMDPQTALAAANFIKDNSHHFRIEIEADQLQQQDAAQDKAERTEWLTAFAAFLQNAAPMAQQMPGSVPALLEILRWTMAPMKGSQAIGGVLDQAIEQAKAALQQQQASPQAQQQDPKMLTAQVKGQQDLAKIQAQAQSDMAHIQAETQALAQRRMTDAAIGVKEEQARAQIKAHHASLTGVAPQ